MCVEKVASWNDLCARGNTGGFFGKGSHDTHDKWTACDADNIHWTAEEYIAQRKLGNSGLSNPASMECRGTVGSIRQGLISETTILQDVVVD